ncbi:MAG: I78 family peptidase inhibitor [Novosphingobium sp.]|nr:I78 family peptidase inhibitor [Novosphingobium sp.]
MRSILLTAVAALALAACGDSIPPDATASPNPSGTFATTNATVEPVTTATVTSSPGASPTATATASPKPMPTPTASPTNVPSSECGANKAARFVGRTATPDVRAQVIEAVGHNRIRWIGPDTAVTMDFSEARLNADLTAANRITGFRCG